MNDLGLELGKEIPHPFYLDSKVLQRKPICGGITLENEKEIFLDKPVSPENAQKELEKRLNELDDLRKKLEKEES
jgi:hypothetical protein